MNENLVKRWVLNMPKSGEFSFELPDDTTGIRIVRDYEDEIISDLYIFAQPYIGEKRYAEDLIQVIVACDGTKETRPFEFRWIEQSDPDFNKYTLFGLYHNGYSLAYHKR